MKILTFFAVPLLLAGSAANLLAGPISEYYLTVGQQNLFHVVQGSSVNRTWLGATDWQSSLAVVNTVRTMGAFPGYSGQEFTLSGSPTGTTYPFPLTGGEFYDGTTDGVYNYAWDRANGIAYRFDRGWANPVVLFVLGTTDGARLGITHDPTNDSLWISGWDGTVGNKIENRAMNGALLSSFYVAHDKNVALALDPVGGTLWLNDRNKLDSGLAPVFEQYSKTGTLLSTQSYPTLLGENILGGEFVAGMTGFPPEVPEPSALALWSCGGLILFAIVRRRRLRSPRPVG